MRETSRNKILYSFPEDYQKQRKQGWNINADFWKAYVRTSSNRQKLYRWVINELISEMGAGWNPIKAVDYGCGEGTFINLLNSRFSCKFINGIDYSKEMITNAKKNNRKGNEEWTEVDFERGPLNIENDYDLSTAILSFIEVMHLDRAIKNLATCLKKNGVAVILTLDPIVELIRSGGFEAMLSFNTYKKFEKVIVQKRFLTNIGYSEKPYYKVLRPISSYWKASSDAGLQLVAEKCKIFKDSLLESNTASIYYLLILKKNGFKAFGGGGLR